MTATVNIHDWFNASYWLPNWESWSRIPRVVAHDVTLIEQTTHWDCGLACVLMVLKYQGNDEQRTLQSLMDMCLTERVWTIDLAYLMKKLKMQFVFVTRTIGADPSFASLPYYTEQMLEDQLRVNALFQVARAEDIPILHQSLSVHHLRQMCLSSSCLIILLVDNRKLQMLRNDMFWMLYCLNIDLGFGETFGYEGHYVILTGYDEWVGKFHVHDPDGGCYWVLESIVDAARVSHGTDEDMIIVYT